MKLLPPFNPEFIGRQDAINEFHSIRTLREQKNVLYIEAVGGSGKTWLLQEYIRHCQDQRRPWHTGPREMNLELRPIDFYNLENRTVDGLRRSITRRLGLERFENFLEADNLLQNEKNATRLAEARRDTDFWFFRETKQALREMGTYTALFFDTFETVHNRRVGRWFLKEFLPSRALTGAIIVFAGRPSSFEMPSNVHSYNLKAFSDDEALDYFRKKWNIHPDDQEGGVIQACKGKPLLLDLVHYARMREGSIAELVNSPENEFESRLVARFTQQPDLLSEVILSMAYLKRRYNRSIFEYRNGDAEISFDELELQLKGLPFVKYRPGEHTFTLHDEFQRMISEHALNWQELADDLYEKIVRGWYEQAIASSEGQDQYLLRAEQLAYVLEHDFHQGLTRYQEYFNEIQTNHLFDLNDVLWGEVAAELRNDRHAYELTLSQANWLETNNRAIDAAFWFEKLLDSPYNDVRDSESAGDVKISLGHCYLQQGEVDRAGDVWEAALQEAKSQKEGEIASFLYNLGHVRYQQGRWEKALDLYESAIREARHFQNQEILGEAYFVMARLRARQGDLDQAVRELRTGLNIIEGSYNRTVRHAQALNYGGDIHRYLDDSLTAQSYYSHAWNILQEIEGYYDWKALTIAGLGSTYNRSGSIKREYGKDIVGDLEDQQKSLEFFFKSLQISRENNTESRLHQIFDRMADTYLELNKLLDHAVGTPLETSVQKLISGASTFSLFEERNWRFRLREPDQSFESLDLLGKAQRLFDLALLQADKFGYPHLMFDSLTQAASVAQQRKRDSDLEYYATLASTLRGLDDPKQEQLFFSFLDLLKAHNIFELSPQKAVELYSIAALNIFEGGVFGRYIIQQQLPIIQKNLLVLPKSDGTHACDFLLDSWKENNTLKDFIQGVKDQMLFL